MFAKRREPKRESAETPADTIIGAGTTIEGSISIQGSARIDGSIQGSLKVTGLLTVGADADIRADVEAGEARVLGTIRGPLRARENVELLERSRLEGDVFAKCLRIEPGAYFQGDCHMGEIGNDGRAAL